MKVAQTTDILIVGAGPTGLMAANQLNRFGVDFLIIDSKSGPTLESRALAVSARSMELYQQLGLAEQVQAQSIPITGFKLYYDGKLKGDGSFKDLGTDKSDFPHLLNIFEQHHNEKLLYENLQKNGAEVLWNTAFESLETYQDYVIAMVKTREGSYQIKSKYVIGCDGASSPVRRSLNFSFGGGTYENKFYVVNVKLKTSLDADRITLAPADEIFTAFFPMKGERRFRLVGTLHKTISEKENITFEDIKNAVKYATKFELDFEEVQWFSIYKLHHRCVDTFSKGNIFLAGDSAHIHSPAGGQGMNTGLQDAHNICWKLAFVLKGYANKSLLETYNAERLPFAKWLLGFTDRGFNIISSNRWLTTFFRKYIVMNVMSKLFTLANIQQRIYGILSQTAYSYADSLLSKMNSKQKLTFNAGDRLPYIRNGTYKDFSDPCFHLLHISDTQNIDADTITYAFTFPVKIVQHKISDGWDKFGVTDELYILIRPDTYIAFVFDNINELVLNEYFEKTFF